MPSFKNFMRMDYVTFQALVDESGGIFPPELQEILRMLEVVRKARKALKSRQHCFHANWEIFVADTKCF